MSPARSERTVDELSTRAACTDDAALFACLSETQAEGEVRLIAVDTTGTACAVGRMIPAGCTTQPDRPRLEIDWPGPVAPPPAHTHTAAAPAISGTVPGDAMIARVLETLLPVLQDALPGGPESTASVGWCPLEPVGQRLLRAAGFRPTGGGAYRETSSGMIRWVDGYQDPTGSTIDLIR